MAFPIRPLLLVAALVLLTACSGDGGGGPTEPRLPEVAGTYAVAQPRTGGTCDLLDFLPFRAVVTQDDEDVVITQTEPVPFIPYVGTVEEDGDFEARIARQPAFDEGIEAESDVQGRFAARGLTAREVLTVYDVGASAIVRSDVGLPAGRSSCTHVLDWEGDLATDAARRLSGWAPAPDGMDGTRRGLFLVAPPQRGAHPARAKVPPPATR